MAIEGRSYGKPIIIEDPMFSDGPIVISEEMTDFAEKAEDNPNISIHTWIEPKPKRYRAWSGS